MHIRGERLFFCTLLIIVIIVIPGSGTAIPAWNITIPGISDISMSDDGSRVIVGTNTGQALVYDRNGTMLWETTNRGTVLTGCIGNGSAFLVASREALEPNKGELRLFSGNGSQEWFYNPGWVTAMDVSGNRVVTGDRQGNVIVLDRNGGEIARFNDYPKMNIISGLSLSSDGKYVAYSNEERNPQVKFWTVDTRSKKAFSRSYTFTSIYADNEPIRQVKLSGDGAYIVTAGGEGNHGLLVFYAKNGTRMWSKDLPRIRDLEISEDGSSVYTGTADGDIRCYSRSGDLEWIFSTGAGIGALSLSKDGVIAAGNSRGDLFALSRTGGVIWNTRVECFPNGAISHVEISDDGSALSASTNGRSLWYFPVILEPGIVLPDVNGNSTLSLQTQDGSPPDSTKNLTTPGLQDNSSTLPGGIPAVPEEGPAFPPFPDMWNMSGIFRKFM
jgi:WD40 repeat protein